ncbi:hypothetical protein HX137_29380 [Pseudomonas sp. 165]|uniref:Uncharacterized protein n=1 Tax=Pseudomonas juntendi TaxID=2666183 RepID=A0AAJ5V229_9PSED|nr:MULTISPECIES: hypothetical protein [Pseudomonas]MDM1714737.1 hypothetical protein [Pseudomonas sp. 165]WEA23673.1 hypothetical protein PWA60_27110 [Pseudomonas juntendi]
MTSNRSIASLCKGFVTVLLAVIATLVAVYAHHAHGGWIFAISFVLLIGSTIPMILHFSPQYTVKKTPPRKQKDLFEEFEDLDKPGLFDDPLTGFHRSEDD